MQIPLAQQAAAADLVVVVLDSARPRTPEDALVMERVSARAHRALVVANKCDLPASWPVLEIPGALPVSARSGAGMAELAARLAAFGGRGDQDRGTPVVTNARHVRLLRHAAEAVAQAQSMVERSSGTVAEEFVAADVHRALAALDELVGTRTPEDVLHEIFARFCIGK